MVTIVKSDAELNHKNKPEHCSFEKAFLIKYSEGHFYKEPLEDVKVLFQSPYEVLHDILADLFYRQLNHGSYAYTSTSSIAGHHNMDESGTLIFWRGQIVYVFDKNPNEGSEDYDESQIYSIEDY